MQRANLRPPTLTYTPTANTSGTDTLAFLVNDGIVDSALAVVTFEVVSTNVAPVFTSVPH